MARRKIEQASVSLFSFQAIIMGVTGLMLVITLILAMELVNRVEAAPAAQSVHEEKESKKSIDELKREIAAVQSRLESARVRVEDLPTLTVEEMKRRAEDLAADSASLQNEIDETNARVDRKARDLEEAKSRSATESKSIRQQREAIEKEIAETEKKLKEIEEGKRVHYKSGVTGKRMWLVEIAGPALRVGEMEMSKPPLGFRSQVQFIGWARKLDAETNGFLLVLKPGGLESFRRCREVLLDINRGGIGFDVGVHVVAADQQVLDPETGAGGP